MKLTALAALLAATPYDPVLVGTILASCGAAILMHKAVDSCGLVYDRFRLKS